jgi:hypothetical protein
MAAMTTVLKGLSGNGSTNLTYLVNSVHTAAKPALVHQRRKTPSNGVGMLEDSFAVAYATNDTDGILMPSRTQLIVTFKRPVGGESAIETAVKAVFIDIANSDEWAATMNTQERLSSS